MLSFFPRHVLDEILNLIESISGGVPNYCFNVRCMGTLNILILEWQVFPKNDNDLEVNIIKLYINSSSQFEIATIIKYLHIYIHL